METKKTGRHARARGVAWSGRRESNPHLKSGTLGPSPSGRPHSQPGRAMGIEPTIFALGTRCSTTELHPRSAQSGQPDLHRRSKVWKTWRPLQSFARELAAPWVSHPPFNRTGSALGSSVRARSESPRPQGATAPELTRGIGPQPSSIPMRRSTLELRQQE